MPEPDTVNVSQVMRIMGRWGFGHACPTDGHIITAAHIVNPFHKIPTINALLVDYAWSDGNGNQGMLRGGEARLSRDLGVLLLESGTPDYYPHALAEPIPGDTLYWVEYDTDSPATAFMQKKKNARLLRKVSGHLVLDKELMRGASGSCLLNEKDEAVGVITWGLPTKAGSGVGVAVSISGYWWMK